MKKEREKKEVIKSCYNHKLKNASVKSFYPFDQICIQCLEEKVQVLWDYYGEQVNPEDFT